VRVITPTHYVGAVVAIFNEQGSVLLVEHVFRTDYPWGLPGGWISRSEAPNDAVKREVLEELKLEIEVKDLLSVARIPATRMSNHPAHLGMAYYGRLLGGVATPSGEVLSMRWADPENIEQELAPFQKQAIAVGAVVFKRDRQP